MYPSPSAPLSPVSAEPTRVGHPLSRYAWMFGALNGLFAALQVMVSVSAALESRAPLSSLYYGIHGSGFDPSMLVAWLGPLISATYGTCLLGFIVSLWLCWHAGRAVASAAGARSGGAVAGLLTSVIGSGVWMVVSIAAIAIAHTDGSITGILNTNPGFSAASVRSEGVGLVVQELVAASLSLGFGAIAGHLGAATVSVTASSRRNLPQMPPSARYMPMSPHAVSGPTVPPFAGSTLYPPPPEVYRAPWPPAGWITPGAPQPSSWPAPMYPPYPPVPPYMPQGGPSYSAAPYPASYPPYPGYPQQPAFGPAMPLAPASGNDAERESSRRDHDMSGQRQQDEQ